MVSTVTVNALNTTNQIEQNTLEDLLARTALHDRGAFEHLYQSVSPRLLGFILRMLQNKAEAEDVLQDVFIKLWHKAKDYRAHEENAKRHHHSANLKTHRNQSKAYNFMN